MTPPKANVTMTDLVRPLRSLARLVACIRFDEVLVLQGPPFLGVCFAIGALTMGKIAATGLLAVGSVCLVAHIFVLNDWSGIAGDLRDPDRAMHVFTTRGVRRAEVGYLAIALLFSSLTIFGFLGTATFVLALAIAGLSALYSVPVFHMKGLPIANSVLHLVGGTLHFLLGYGTFTTLDGRGVAIGIFFGLVFTAGHLMHEARGREGDLINGIRTNAVVFGRWQSLVAASALFTVAQALLVGLAAVGVLPRALCITAALYPVHVYASFKALHADPTLQRLCRLQRQYRLLYAFIGVMMIVTSRLA